MSDMLYADVTRHQYISAIFLNTTQTSRWGWMGATASALLLILSFPNFSLHFLAWIALAPLLVTVARRPAPYSSFILGWFTGTLFFYATCYWLTYSMIHYGGLPSWLAYLLLAPAAIVVGLFPALATLGTTLTIRRWGVKAVFFAPLFWVTCEWARLGVTGQLWNALGYSQAEVLNGALISPARFGGVYVITFLIVAVNSAVAFAALKRTLPSLLLGVAVVAIIPLAVFFTHFRDKHDSGTIPYLYVVAVQPNVPMTPAKSPEEFQQLLDRHLQMSSEGLQQLPADSFPRLVVWPESPMNFTYGTDRTLQEVVTKFTREHHTSLLLNSLEVAPRDGSYNSALLINEDGRLIAQYDKIRLMPFGEYVPLPQWLGGSLISAIVGDFTPGTNYTLMPVAQRRAGTFICIESAYPWIARRFTDAGADLLINISNDGYLGPTAVMRQHLANVIFRAVENGRPVLRVTNTGLSAHIRSDGFVEDLTAGFEPTVRVWKVSDELKADTFYAKHGDVFAIACSLAVIAVLFQLVFSKKGLPI